MKKLLISFISLFFVLTLMSSIVVAKEDNGNGNEEKDKKKKETPIVPLSKPIYYEPYNTPSNPGHDKDYNNDWDKKTEDVEKQKKEK